MRALRFSLVGALFLAACGVETVVHDLDEREANKIIELLADSDIQAQKGMRDTGREVTYSIAVPSTSRLRAIRLLNQHEMPQRRDMGYNEIFSESGLIPTSAEEKAKKLASIEGEIQRQLKLIDGILDVQVQLVIPDETALRTTQDQVPATTASVTIKYMPGAGGTKPLSEPQVQAVVAAGVEKLTSDNVVVVMTPGAKFIAGKTGAAMADSSLANERGLRALTNKQLNMVVVGFVSVILIVGVAWGLAQMRLRTVRSRLIRLQTEIAKARRRPGEGTP